MIINVTQEDIDGGKIKSCFQCPVALAVQRQTGLATRVGTGRIKVRDSMLRCGWTATPRSVSLFIYHFDYGHDEFIRPFNFELPEIDIWNKGNWYSFMDV